MASEAPAPRPNRLVMILGAVIAALLLVVVGLVFFMLGQQASSGDEPVDPVASSSPSASPSGLPSAAPGETPDAAVEPDPTTAPDTSTRFTSFTAPTTVTCDAGDEDYQPPKPEINVSWSSANAVEAWYSPGNQDAKTKNYMRVPLSGDQNDLTDEHLFPCFDQGPSRDYTITLVGPNGERVSKTWTVTDLSR